VYVFIPCDACADSVFGLQRLQRVHRRLVEAGRRPLVQHCGEKHQTRVEASGVVHRPLDDVDGRARRRFPSDRVFARGARRRSHEQRDENRKSQAHNR